MQQSVNTHPLSNATTDLLFRLREGKLGSPFWNVLIIDTPRLPAGNARGVAGLDDSVEEASFCDMARVLVCTEGATGGGGTKLRRAGGAVTGTGGGSLSDAALGRAGGSGGAERLGEASSPPCGFREGGTGTMREGADEIGRAGGGGGGSLPGTIGGTAVFRAGITGARDGTGGTAVDSANTDDD